MTWDFKEEKKPCGKKGITFNPGFHNWIQKPDISNILVAQPKSHPWFLILWEQLLTHAPSPATVQPYCCYIKTIVFYHRPYIIDPFSRLWKSNNKWHISEPGSRLLKYDQIEHSLTWNDKLVWNDEIFKCGGGKVVWKNKQWWMCQWARREIKK